MPPISMIVCLVAGAKHFFTLRLMCEGGILWTLCQDQRGYFVNMWGGVFKQKTKTWVSKV